MDEKRRFWSVLFVDIVDYSGLDAVEQREAIENLTKVVKAAKVLSGANFKHGRNTDHFFLPTGDGMIIGFAADYEGPVNLARQIHELYGPNRKRLKIGIHGGPAVRYKDIRNDPNFAGSSINMAARVESCCSGGHILVARDVGEELLKISKNEYSPLLDGPYNFKVKWDKRIAAYNYFDKKGTFGNLIEPENNRIHDLDYRSLKQQLAKAGGVGDLKLRNVAFAHQLAGRPILGNAVLDWEFNGFVGVIPDKVKVTMTGEPPPVA